MLFDKAEDSGQNGNVIVRPNAQILRADPALRKHCGRLRKYNGCSAHCPAAKVDKVPIVRIAVAARIFTHRRDADAIPQTHVANLEGSEEMSRRGGPSTGGRSVTGDIVSLLAFPDGNEASGKSDTLAHRCQDGARKTLRQKPTTVVAIYPGSFDPITNGHLDLIERGSALFDRLIVAVLRQRREAGALFASRSAMEMLKEVVTCFPTWKWLPLTGLLVDYAAACSAHSVILRGIRAISDYEYELQMALMNHRLRPGIETVFLMAGEENSFISSRLVKEVFGWAGTSPGLVPPSVEGG